MAHVFYCTEQADQIKLWRGADFPGNWLLMHKSAQLFCCPAHKGRFIEYTED
jgi:hypothetical protein